MFAPVNTWFWHINTHTHTHSVAEVIERYKNNDLVEGFHLDTPVLRVSVMMMMMMMMMNGN